MILWLIDYSKWSLYHSNIPIVSYTEQNCEPSENTQWIYCEVACWMDLDITTIQTTEDYSTVVLWCLAGDARRSFSIRKTTIAKIVV